jgi:hypothetical protein
VRLRDAGAGFPKRHLAPQRLDYFVEKEQQAVEDFTLVEGLLAAELGPHPIEPPPGDRFAASLDEICQRLHGFGR